MSDTVGVARFYRDIVGSPAGSMRPALRRSPLRTVGKDDGKQVLAVPLAPFDPVVVLSGHEELGLETLRLGLRNRLFRFQLHVIPPLSMPAKPVRWRWWMGEVAPSVRCGNSAILLALCYLKLAIATPEAASRSIQEFSTTVMSGFSGEGRSVAATLDFPGNMIGPISATAKMAIAATRCLVSIALSHLHCLVGPDPS